MNFFEALAKADQIIAAIKLLIGAIEKLQESNSKLETKQGELLAAIESKEVKNG